jgi:hypothetical protein
MAEYERTRVREREPEEGSTYERSMRIQKAVRDRAMSGKIVIKASDRPFETSRQGVMRYYQVRETTTDTALKDWAVFLQDIRRHSGKHRHQGGLVIFVLEGEGYTIVDGERIDWEAGDLILLPFKPGGVEHQHFNRYADQSCKWMAFIHKPMMDELGSYMEQQEPAATTRS